ncbi:MAG: lipopolysaccharide biosynthesis protein [Solirubrobacteraceae bacterium]
MSSSATEEMSSPSSEIPRGRVKALRGRYQGPISDLRKSDTAKAAGLAGAMIVNNVIALGATVVFARLLSDYGALAALISYFLILGVAGQAMQVATAREGVLGHLGTGPGLIATLRRWTRTMVWVTLTLTVVSVLLRGPIASAVGVSSYPWAAALGIPAGCLWLELSILRGALQGVGDYKSVGISLVGEQGSRLLAGAVLAVVGLGVAGAYLGTPLSFVIMGVYCVWMLRRATAAAAAEGSGAALAPAGVSAEIELWTHVKRAWAPICGLIVLAVMQNIDIIAAKHRFNGVPDLASSYAATAVAAKVLIWVAIGAGFYLVPEVSRRRHAGEDTRPVLARAVGIIAVCSVPVLLIFALGSHELLLAAFGSKRLRATDSLFVLGVAFTMLACTYLAVQYMLALKRTWFLVPLALVAVAEPVLLLQAPSDPKGFATVVLAIQAAGAALAYAIALRPERTVPVSTPAAEDYGPAPFGEVA